MTTPPTLKQLKALSAFEKFYVERGYAPTVRELARKLRLSSRATHQRMMLLSEAGLLTPVAWGRPRAYRVTDAGREWLARVGQN